MDAKVTMTEGKAFLGTATSGHEIVLDTSVEGGGLNSGFRPMELMALGTIGCASMDVTNILRKMKVDFSAYECRVQVESSPDYPRVFTSMVFEYIITGKGVREEDVEKAVVLAETKYCQGIAMMAKSAEISHNITIIEEKA